NMLSMRERLEGHIVPLLLRLLGIRQFARLVVSLGASELGRERGDWMVGLMAGQDKVLMLAGGKEAMSFDSRRPLASITCPTLVVAGANDHAVPIHHARMLHDGIAGSRLVVVEDAGHTLIWTHTDAFVRVVEEFLAT